MTTKKKPAPTQLENSLCRIEDALMHSGGGWVSMEYDPEHKVFRLVAEEPDLRPHRKIAVNHPGTLAEAIVRFEETATRDSTVFDWKTPNDD